MLNQPKSLVLWTVIRTFANDYEKSRNEKIRNMENPFKFGTIVEAEYNHEKIFTVIFLNA